MDIAASEHAATDVAAHGQMAAQGAGDKESSLPQIHSVELEEGSVICTLYQNREKLLAVEFRSNVPRGKYSGVEFSVIHKATKEEVVNAVVPFAQEFVLSELLEPSEEYDLSFSLLPVPE